MARLVVICGPAGAGKSTYGRKLARETGACLLDSDTVTEPVVRAGMALGELDPDDRDSPAYREAFRGPVYECLFQVAAENLPHCDVILVGPFTSEIRDPNWHLHLFARFEIVPEIIYVWAEDECVNALQPGEIHGILRNWLIGRGFWLPIGRNARPVLIGL